jgi:hypothetical protein
MHFGEIDLKDLEQVLFTGNELFVGIWDGPVDIWKS